MGEMRQTRGSRRAGCWSILAGLATIAAIAVLPASASAAPCASGSTAWNGGSGDFHTDSNWTNGGPSASCDTLITANGTYTVSMTGGASMKSLTLGGAGGTQTLSISAQNSGTTLDATTTGISVNGNAAIVLDCPVLGCSGGSGGAPRINVGSSALTNAGTITVTALASGAGGISGSTTNTGTLQFNGDARFDNGSLLNQGTINIATGKTVTSAGSSCGDPGVVVKNNSGGQINAAGTGTLSVVNYEQGEGTTSGTSPVNMPCGSLKYFANGASKVQANGDISLNGAMQPGQSLILFGAGNMDANLTSHFVNNGSITLDCPGVGCSEPRINAAGNLFTNAGTLTVTPAAGGGGGLGGSTINTGTMQFNGSADLGGVFRNRGVLNIAGGVTLTSSGSSCGDTSASVKNDNDGQINATGTGTLNVSHYEQGTGTTSGATPVSVGCGSLKYSGNGASTVQVSGSLNMTGNIGSAQTLRIVGAVNTPAFTNAGTILFDQSAASLILNASGTLTNAGRLSGDGTLTGSVNNQSGTVAPGASLGTLTVSDNYTQGAAGNLEIEVAGTGAGQFDKLAVGGNATLGGKLTLQPTSGYAASAAIGDNVGFLAYGGTRTNPFAQTTVNPSPACPKQFVAAYNDGAKNVSAVVSSSGVVCGAVDPPPVVAPPKTRLGTHPRSPVKTKKAKAGVKFSFSADVAGATFQCKLDKKPFAPCASPKSYKAKPGKHKFSVRAVGPGGTDPTPAAFTFRVVKKK